MAGQRDGGRGPYDYTVRDMPAPCSSHETLNVGGHLVIVGHSTWAKIESALRDKYTDEWGYMIVNRDYRYFRHVVDCLQALPGAVPPLPESVDELRGIAAEFEFFNLPVPSQVTQRLTMRSSRSHSYEYDWHAYRAESERVAPRRTPQLHINVPNGASTHTPELPEAMYDSGIASRSNTPGDHELYHREPGHSRHYLSRPSMSNHASLRPSPTVSPRPFEPSSRHQLHSPRSAPHLWQQDQSAHDTRDRVASIPPYRSAHKVPIPRALNAAGAPYSRPGSREGTAKSRASTTKNSPTAECGSHRGTTAAGVDTPSGVVKAEASLEDAEGRRFIAHPHSVRSLVSEEPQSAPQQATRPRTGLSLEGEKVCTNCKTTETCLWRDVECGNSFIRLCNACGLYFRAHNRHRDPTLGRGRPRGTTKKR